MGRVRLVDGVPRTDVESPLRGHRYHVGRGTGSVRSPGCPALVVEVVGRVPTLAAACMVVRLGVETHLVGEMDVILRATVAC